MKKKILILAPHADDEILGCGGTIAKFNKLGHEVYVLILTNANVGAPEIFKQKDIELIRKESVIANKIIGTKKLFFENLPALNLNNYPLYKISNLINDYLIKINPNIIFIPSLIDINLDHKIIFNASKVALRPNKKNNIEKIFSYEVLSETEWNENNLTFSPNYFVKLNKSHIDLKIKSFLKYKSQVKKFPNPRSKEGILNLSKLRGSNISEEYSEAFKVERIIS
jgi:N-acetylglucosamine malate deacetylase 1